MGWDAMKVVMNVAVILTLGIADTAKAGDSTFILCRIDKDGTVLFSGGKAEGDGEKGAGWNACAERIVRTCTGKPSMASDGCESIARGMLDATLRLGWNAKKSRCSVAVDEMQCGESWSGFSKAKSKLRSMLRKNWKGVTIEVDGDVEAKWVLSALKTVREIKPLWYFFIAGRAAMENPEAGESLRRFPIRDPKESQPRAVTVEVEVDPATPFRYIATLIVYCKKSRVGAMTLTTGKGKAIDTFLPPGAWKLTGRGSGMAARESSIASALDWLARHRNESGLWSCKAFGKRCPESPCGGKGSDEAYDMGVSALALLAFLGAGHTQKLGDHQKVVKAALKAIQGSQDEDGCYGGKGGQGHWIYCHSLATFAVSEALQAGADARLRASARKAVDFLAMCQKPGLGWRYGVQPDKCDTSCTAVAVEALASARRAGLQVPESAFLGALKWLELVTDDTYFKTGYTSKGDSGARLAEALKFRPSETMTAAAIVTRILSVGDEEAALVFEDENEAARKIVLQTLPTWSETTVDMYYWYWGTFAMVKTGGEAWKRWESRLVQAIVPNQRADGCAAGSWDPVGAWGTAGGRVYSTAVCALALEAPYGFLSILRKK